MNKNFNKKLKKEIEKCGFPLEIFVIEACSKKNTGRIPNLRYRYEGELRELDLYAHFTNFEYDKKSNPQHTTTNLIIECKKSKNKPWVFFSSHMYERSDSYSFLSCMSTHDFKAKLEKDLLIFKLEKKIKNHHYFNKSTPKCISYFEAFSSPKQESDIYLAIKSVLDFINQEKKDWKTIFKSYYDAKTDFYYPIIVLDGDLFEAKIRGEKFKIIKRNHLQIRGNIDRETYIVDIVKRDYFEKFLDMIEDNHNNIVQAIKKMRFSKSFKINCFKRAKERYPEHL